MLRMISHQFSCIRHSPIFNNYLIKYLYHSLFRKKLQLTNNEIGLDLRVKKIHEEKWLSSPILMKISKVDEMNTER